MEAVQSCGRKKTSTAIAHVRKGNGQIKVNGVPLELVEPELLRFKVYEPLLILGRKRFESIDFNIRVRGGGQVSRMYGMVLHFFRNVRSIKSLIAIRQAIARGLVSYYQKCSSIVADQQSTQLIFL